MEAVLGLTALVLAAACVALFTQLQKARSLAAIRPADDAVAGRLEATKREVGALKEELAKKQRQLEDAREEAKRKAKKEAMKAEKADEKAEAADPRDVEITGLRKGLSTLEQQIDGLKKDAERRVQEAKMTSESEAERKLREVQTEADALRTTLEELRASIKRKNEERPDVPGSALDLKALPAEAVQELARYFRKGEEYERLYHVAAGQLQLANDKIQELQRRYYAVCRELAVAAGNAGTISDEDAKRNAEALLAAGDRLGRAAHQQSAPPQGASQPPQQAAGEGAPVQLGPDGQPLRKKRRRRRKKKHGQGALPLGENGAPAAAEGADDEGDEGDEGEDEGAQAAPTSEPAPASDAPAAAPAPEPTP